MDQSIAWMEVLRKMKLSKKTLVRIIVPMSFYATCGVQWYACCIYETSRASDVNTIQTVIPTAVGIAAAIPVHFQLPVSFFMVRSVVEQGQ